MFSYKAQLSLKGIGPSSFSAHNNYSAHSTSILFPLCFPTTPRRRNTSSCSRACALRVHAYKAIYRWILVRRSPFNLLHWDNFTWMQSTLKKSALNAWITPRKVSFLKDKYIFSTILRVDRKRILLWLLLLLLCHLPEPNLKDGKKKFIYIWYSWLCFCYNWSQTREIFFFFFFAELEKS